MNDKASVIIPVYNAERTLIRCAESILYGMERNVQVILVDDCSSDSSWSICRSLAAKHDNVTAVQNVKNSGVSYTRNHGLQEASGKYVLFADSDDWVSGRFAAEMIEMAEREPKRLVTCGFHFLDRVHGESRDYLWENTDRPAIEVCKGEYFELVSKVLIQFVWNKIFRLDVIRKYGLSFREDQSMGEDFQFVLDYLKVSGAESIQVINQPLYYYIRANTSSLISKMGLVGYEEGVNRLTQLAGLSGCANTGEYWEQIANQQTNFQYQIVHDPHSSRRKKIEMIEAVMQDGRAAGYYRSQHRILMKENFLKAKSEIKLFWNRAVGWLKRKKRSRKIRKMREEFRGGPCTILSQNCIAGVFYHDMGQKFLSPTIDLYFSAPDFIKFVLHLREYLSMPLKMSWKESYPVGILGDIAINFMHYHTCTEAVNAWERRKNRMQWDKILVISTDREGFDEEVYRQWNLISYPKVLFTAQKRFAQNPDAVYYPEYEKDGFVPDLIPEREFYKDQILIDTINKVG